MMYASPRYGARAPLSACRNASRIRAPNFPLPPPGGNAANTELSPSRIVGFSDKVIHQPLHQSTHTHKQPWSANAKREPPNHRKLRPRCLARLLLRVRGRSGCSLRLRAVLARRLTVSLPSCEFHEGIFMGRMIC